MIREPDTNDGMVDETPAAENAPKPSLRRWIGGLLGKRPRTEAMVPGATPALLDGSVRIAWDGQPLELKLGKVALEFHPDLSVTGGEIEGHREWIVHAGRAFYQGVPKFIRIRPGEPVLLGRGNEMQDRIFHFDGSVARRHVRISNRRGELTIEPLELDRSTAISAISSPTNVWEARRANLKRLPELLGRALVPFDDEEALGIIGDVNGILAKEVYREANDDGAPGGILRFPDDMTVVIMGDVHARIDNVLRVITEGGLLAALERGKACLVFLGDLVHSEENDELEDMETSLFALDLFCMLKLRFPKNIFFIRGNHESFSPEVGKGGVPQGLLLRKHLKKRRGKDYVTEIETLFDGLAYIVQGNDFGACHGGPVRSKITRDTLVNVHRYPGLQAEIVWNRLRHGNRLAGYGKGSVRRFREMLHLRKHAPVIVGHSPISTMETFWADIGGISGHHLVFSAHTDRLATMVMCGGHATPLEFIPEPALAFLHDDPNT